MPNTFDIDILSEVIAYCPETGLLTWKPRPSRMFSSQGLYSADRVAACWNAKHAGKRAGTRSPDGYVRVGLAGMRFKAHRIAWALTYGYWPSDLDHCNRKRADNRLLNLRDAGVTGNARNHGIQKNNTSGATGVRLRRSGGFDVRVNVGTPKRTKYLGVFKTFDLACAARKVFDIRRGYHPNHGRVIQ